MSSADLNPRGVSSNKKSENSEGLSLLARLVWMMGGNIALLFSFFWILKPRESASSGADIAVPVILLIMIAARYADVRFFGGSTSDGEPATMRDFYKWAALLSGISVVLWGLAHLAAGWMPS